jgi:hypothetical protein
MRRAPAEAGALCKFYGGCLSLAASPPDLGRNLTSPRANPWVPPRGRLIERQRRGWGGLSPSHEQIKKKPRTRGASRGFGFRVEPVMGRDLPSQKRHSIFSFESFRRFCQVVKKERQPKPPLNAAWSPSLLITRTWDAPAAKTLPRFSLNRLAATIKQGHELVAALPRLAVKRGAFAGRK